MEELVQKIRELKKAHRNQFNQIDLNLETTPRDSRYSQQLLEMMKKEELLLSREPSAQSTRVLVQKVDEGLRSETQAFFAKLSSQNIRKWEQLNEKFKKDRNQLRNLLKRQSSPSIDNPTVTLEAEEERLAMDYYKNWHQYESYHLQQAFQSQLARIDADWLNHEKTVQREYEVKKAAILGVQHNHISTDYNDQHNNRWQHPEKQKTLIHTAPVFTPNTSLRPSSAHKLSGNQRKRESYNTVELEKIEKEYKEAMASLQLQKADAKRWLTRQQVRLSVQCEEVGKEKSAQYSLLSEDFSDLDRFRVTNT